MIEFQMRVSTAARISSTEIGNDCVVRARDGSGANAPAVFTVSDYLVKHEETTPEERETSFNDMIKIALETAVED